MRYKTIERDLQEAHEHLKNLLQNVKERKIQDGELLPELEHICMHINAAYNKRNLTLDQAFKKSKTDKKWNQFSTPLELLIK